MNKQQILALRAFFSEENITKEDLIDILMTFISEEYLYSILGMFKYGYTVEQIKDAEVY